MGLFDIHCRCYRGHICCVVHLCQIAIILLLLLCYIHELTYCKYFLNSTCLTETAICSKASMVFSTDLKHSRASLMYALYSHSKYLTASKESLVVGKTLEYKKMSSL
ncbi:hypothetical protein Pelo_9755 [Pelomyxa schiedti]|nr:hypothetical protein Pelo_9755 [Pelomyxa schiedti]